MTGLSVKTQKRYHRTPMMSKNALENHIFAYFQNVQMQNAWISISLRLFFFNFNFWSDDTDVVYIKIGKSSVGLICPWWQDFQLKNKNFSLHPYSVKKRTWKPHICIFSKCANAKYMNFPKSHTEKSFMMKTWHFVTLYVTFSSGFRHMHIFCNIFAIIYHFFHVKTKTWHFVTLFVIFLLCFRHMHIFVTGLRFYITLFIQRRKHDISLYFS